MGSERRRYQRFSQVVSFKCHPSGNLMEPWRQAFLLDFSAGGMAFSSEQLFEPTTILEMEVVLPIERDPLILSGQVVWARQGASGLYEHGIQFVDLTPDRETLIDELVQFFLKKRVL